MSSWKGDIPGGRSPTCTQDHDEQLIWRAEDAGDTHEGVGVVAVEEEAEGEAHPALLLHDEVNPEADQERANRGAAPGLYKEVRSGRIDP